MKAHFVSILIVVASLVGWTAQSATITFVSDADLTVKVCEPIDGAYNSSIASNVLNLKKNTAVEYPVSISEFGFVCCRLLDESQFSVLLLSDDKLKISFKNASPNFGGSNAAGQTFLRKYGFGNYHGMVDSLVRRAITNKIDFAGLDDAFNNKRLHSYNADIQRLSSANEISKNYETVLKKDLDYARLSVLEMTYRNILRGRTYSTRPTSADSAEIFRRILTLYEGPNVINDKTLRYNFAFITDYIRLKWNQLSKEERANLRGTIPGSTFGETMYYLAAPTNMQAVLFGSRVLEDMKYKNVGYERIQLFEYLKAKYPESGYIKHIENRLK